MKRLACLLAILGFAGSALAQTASEPVKDLPLPAGANLHSLLYYNSIVFDFEPRAEEIAPWSIEVKQDRSGTFREKNSEARAITVSDATLSVIFKGGGAVSEHHCETKLKNIASTGRKKVSYVLGPSLATCSFNYSDDADLNATAEMFQAMAATMQFGSRLAHEHRFDRLSLDAEMTSLANEAKAGRAIELQNIAPVLKSIAEDERVIGRARREAARLLEDAGKSVPALEGKTP